MHNADVLEDDGINVLQDPVVQIAFNQVLNKLDVVITQHDEACKDLYWVAMGKGKQTASPTEELPWKIQKQDLPLSSIDRAPVLPYIETVHQGKDVVMEDQPSEQLIKEKKGDKPSPPKMIVTGSANLVPIAPAGPVRLMQIPVGSTSALPASNVGGASAANGSKSASLAIPIHFPRNVPQGADVGTIEVEAPQTYSFPKKYPEHPVTMTHHEESDKQFFVEKPAAEDSNNNGSEDEDPSQVYQEIEPNNNIKMCHLKQAHNSKVKQCLAYDA